VKPGSWARVAHWAVWLPVIAYALQVSRQFFHFTDAGVFLSTDDGVANISYALASEGRYGFLSSPLLAGMPRDHGLFSYGPFYFYAGAALIWLFGYSLTLLRFIHLAVVLAIAATGRAWFGRTAGGAAGAFAAIGLLMAFERVHWPMVRPDSFVSLFAVALVVCAGLAIRTGQSRYWFAAGVAGACGAFTHLVAWSLVPAVIVILAIGYLVAARDDDGKWRRPAALWAPLVMTAMGGLAGSALFYASFGFRIDEQWAFLTDYQKFTGSMGAGTSPGLRELFLKHFDLAYWYLPYPMGYAVWATWFAAIAAVPAMLFFDRGARRREVLALVAPPTVVWVTYLTSLGTYNNFHSGYAILNQVMWLWTGAALLAAVLLVVSAWPAVRMAAVGLAWTAACGLGVGMLTVLAARTDYRALAAAERVPITEYSQRVLNVLPERARAWGSVEFGIEHPNRIQLVQFWDAIKVVEAVEPAQHAPLAPDYLVWGHVENGASTAEVLAAADRIRAGAQNREVHAGPQRLLEAFPSARYTLVSMTAGPPYGVTRVYAWSAGAPALVQPLINVFDPRERQWSSAAGPAVAVALTESSPATINAGAEASASPRTAVQTLQGNLPAGLYLLRVAMAPALKPGEPVVVLATPSTEITVDITDPTNGVDAGPWFAGEPAVFVVYRHFGGMFHVSQFGTGAPAITGVEAAPILTLANYAGMRRVPPPEHGIAAASWIASFPQITLAPAAPGVVSVRGDTTLYGYQAYGPRIPVTPGLRMRIRVPIAVTEGRACLGILDGTGERWLVAPDRMLPEYEFTINDSRTVMPVLANCSASGNIVPIQATIGDGNYALWSDQEELYVDQLMRAFRSASPR